MNAPDVLATVFTPAVMDRFANQREPSETASARLKILSAADVDGVDEGTRRYNRLLCARRDAWREYLTSASHHGVLDGDVIARLTGTDDDNFRSALSECMGCWLLTGPLGLTLRARPAGRDRAVIDLGVQQPDGDINIEVKSPYAPVPQASTWWGGDHSHLLEGALNEANRQFPKDGKNVLMIVPLVEMPILAGRAPFINAFYGDDRIVFTVDRVTGREVGEPENRFITDGKFLKLWPKEPRDTREPRYTRVGAVVRLREGYRETGDGDDFRVTVTRHWFVLHNPNSPQPIPTGMWGDCPQFVEDGDVMRWTDDKPVMGY